MSRHRGQRPPEIVDAIRESLQSLKPPVDWKQVLFDLQRHGWRLAWIADSLNCPISTLHGWYNRDRQPCYEYGHALMDLHRRICGERPLQRPQVVDRQVRLAA